MSDHTEKYKELQRFLLVGPDPIDTPLPPNCGWWRREGIYLSDICLVVHLSPAVEYFKDDAETARAKEALYAYLRRVGHNALEHDLMRPVACVLSVGRHRPSREFLKSLRSWGSDQEWHRGSFTLYIEIEIPEAGHALPPWDQWDRLADLLNPQIEVLTLAPRETRQVEDIRRQLEDQLEKNPPADPQTAELTGNLLRRITPILSSTGDASLDQWKEEIIRQTDRTARGEPG